MGYIEGGSLHRKVGIVQHVAFGVYGEAEFGFPVEETMVISDKGGKPVVSQSNLPLVKAHENGTHFGGGVFAPLGDVVGEGEEAIIPGVGARQCCRRIHRGQFPGWC